MKESQYVTSSEQQGEREGAVGQGEARIVSTVTVVWVVPAIIEVASIEASNSICKTAGSTRTQHVEGGHAPLV